MRILVTGGAGFIGSHTVDRLIAAGHEPFVVDNLSTGCRENLPPDVPLFLNDICDQSRLADIFDETQPELVCHLAAQMSVSRSVREPVFDAEVNILGLLHILEECVRTSVRRVIFSSSGGALYGDVFEPIGEDYPCKPISPYGISKWVGEQYLAFYASEQGLETVALRYTNVYGPRQSPHGEAGVVAIFSEKMLKAEQVIIHGDGKDLRDYVYVDDVARANVMALESEFPKNGIALNVGTGIATDVNTLAAEIRPLCEERRLQSGESQSVPLPRHGPARAGDIRSNLVSHQRITNLLGWQPTVTLADGLHRTIQWFSALLWEDH